MKREKGRYWESYGRWTLLCRVSAPSCQPMPATCCLEASSQMWSLLKRVAWGLASAVQGKGCPHSQASRKASCPLSRRVAPSCSAPAALVGVNSSWIPTLAWAGV